MEKHRPMSTFSQMWDEINAERARADAYKAAYERAATGLRQIARGGAASNDMPAREFAARILASAQRHAPETTDA